MRAVVKGLLLFSNLIAACSAPVIARAVSGLPNKIDEARGAVYERARKRIRLRIEIAEQEVRAPHALVANWMEGKSRWNSAEACALICTN